MSDRFMGVTERHGDRATEAQLLRVAQRYEKASAFAHGKRVLEVACGSGLGLQMLHGASELYAGDLSPVLLMEARTHSPTVPLVAFDACSLPLHDESVDLVIAMEALYYYDNTERFFEEAYRVLRDTGTLFVASVNPRVPGFSPSALSKEYPTASSLIALATKTNFSEVVLEGGFPIPSGSKDRMILGLRSIAARAHLIPGTLRARRLLKRLFYGRTRPLTPQTVRDLADGKSYETTELLSGTSDRTQQVLYLTARKRL